MLLSPFSLMKSFPHKQFPAVTRFLIIGENCYAVCAGFFALHIEIIYIAKNLHLSVLYTIFSVTSMSNLVKTVTVRSIHSNTLRDAQKSCIRMIWRSMKKLIDSLRALYIHRLCLT